MENNCFKSYPSFESYRKHITTKHNSPSVPRDEHNVVEFEEEPTAFQCRENLILNETEPVLYILILNLVRMSLKTFLMKNCSMMRIELGYP